MRNIIKLTFVLAFISNVCSGQEVSFERPNFERPGMAKMPAEDPAPAPAVPRIKVAIPDEAEQQTKELMDKVSSYCNDKNFKGFMGCFTKKMRSEIQKKMEDLFLQHEMTMTIEELVVYNDDDSKIEFGMKYSWDSNHGHTNVIFSKVVAKKEEGEWRVDSEKVQNVVANNRNAAPNVNQNANFDFKGGGQVQFNVNDEFLPRDIKKRPGGGCADGKCATF